MVTKRIRTEYMKKFKDPQWESYSRCYEEMLRYRTARRLLEHSHSPWFWSGSDSDSEAAESPAQAARNRTEALAVKDGQGAEEYEECRGDERISRGRHRVTPAPGSTEALPKIVLPEEVEDVSPSTPAAKGGQNEGMGELRPQAEKEKEKVEAEKEKEEGEEEKKANSRCERKSRQPKPVKTSSKATKAAQHGKRVQSAPKQKALQAHVEGRHPFALYGRGERAADMAAKRTYNVCPAASTVEIHESALRAKTRREVERLLQTQRAEQRRAKSADLDRKGAPPAQPEFNPWLTEYMSCFSARAQ